MTSFVLATALCLFPVTVMSAAAETLPAVAVDQGPNWTDLERADFYGRDQGSRIMPVAWMRALKQANGQPFLADGLSRYGYLPNPTGRDGLPIGFAVTGPGGAQTVGMTCSACHTRQITANGRSYRIDGGPALTDFQSFLADLDAAVAGVLADKPAFNSFAAAILTPSETAESDADALREDVRAWYDRYHALVSRALPRKGWGVGRLDAVGMIFDRLTGLDLGPEEAGFVIAGNIRPADSPVRYPFLWNAPLQDETQWPGFADNGNDILGLARNLGEVYGVFGAFAPRPRGFLSVLNVDYASANSANFDGLNRLESLIRQIGPPVWPWDVDPLLAEQGHAVFDRPTASGGCVECHGVKPGRFRAFSSGTWRTPAQDVGTDSREYAVLGWTARTGSLQGAFVPFVAQPLREAEPSLTILKTAVVGSIVQHYLEAFTPVTSALRRVTPGQDVFALGRLGSAPMPAELRALEGAFGSGAAAVQDVASGPRPTFAYESRVLQGIWAAPPYLHNGSVPSLAELLKPAAQRRRAFKVGPAYDVNDVGLVTDQTGFASDMIADDCSKRDSGNSSCGHEFGTQLLVPDKKALLEYLKTL